MSETMPQPRYVTPMRYGDTGQPFEGVGEVFAHVGWLDATTGDVYGHKVDVPVVDTLDNLHALYISLGHRPKPEPGIDP